MLLEACRVRELGCPFCMLYDMSGDEGIVSCIVLALVACTSPDQYRYTDNVGVSRQALQFSAIQQRGVVTLLITKLIISGVS